MPNEKKDSKSKTESDFDENSAFPIITRLKSPEWIPFSLIWPIPEVYYPYSEKIRLLLSLFAQNYRLHNLETIFWALLMRRFLNRGEKTQSKTDYDFEQDMYKEILSYEITREGYIGFAEVSPTEVYGRTYSSERKSKDTDIHPDIFSTFYAVASLKYLGRLEEYFQGVGAGEKRALLVNFVDRLRKKNDIFHCLNPKCKKCKETFPTQILFYILQTYDFLGINPRGLQSELIGILKSAEKGDESVFRLLCSAYMSIKSGIKEEDLLRLHKLQKPNGGFTFQNSALPDVSNTFWIVYSLETYKWMLPYRAGPVYAFINQVLRDFSPQQDSQASNRMIPIYQIVGLLMIIFESIMNELEDLIFSNLSTKGLMDLSILSIQGGFQGAEAEIVNYLNQKYKFKLEIQDNDLLFRLFVNKLNAHQQKFASQLRDYARTYTQFDISEMRKVFNRGKPKEIQIKDEFLIGLLEEMVKENFFSGTVFRKSHMLFASSYYFARESFIDKVLTCNRAVSNDDIQREKRHLQEVIKDIYNMTREMENSSQNIMQEVESFIIAGDVTIAEERMTSNIKKALVDASFFNKTIDSFRAEFQYIQGDTALVTYIDKWHKLHSTLQQNFSNIRQVLSVKIEELKEHQQEREKVLLLEKFVNQKINALVDQFDNYQEGFKVQLESDYSRKKVLIIKDELQLLHNLIFKIDKEITQFSQQISNKNAEIAAMRKRTIGLWVSQFESFKESIEFYTQGFNHWEEKIVHIDGAHKDFVKRIDNTGLIINDCVKAEDYKKALLLTDQEFPKILKEVNIYSEKLKKELNDYMRKGRKLYPLIRTLEMEWLLYQNVLDHLVQQMRTEFQNSIELDLKSKLKETFKSDIGIAITEIRKSFIDFEKRMNSMLRRDSTFPESAFKESFAEIKKMLSDNDHSFQESLKKGQEQFKDFAEDAKSSIAQWAQFAQGLNQELDQIRAKFEDEQLIYSVQNLAQEIHNNIIPIETLGQNLGKTNESLVEKLTILISEDRINARIIHDPLQIEVHNEDWRRNARLEQYIEMQTREIESQFEKISQFYNVLLSNKEFTKNIAQVKSLITGFTQKIFHITEDYSEFKKSQNINLQNEILKKTDEIFQDKIAQFRNRADQFALATQRTEEFLAFTEERGKFLEDMVHAEIHRLYTDLQNRKIADYGKNVKWFETQKTALNSGISQVDRQVEDHKQKIWAEIASTVTVITDIEQQYKQRKITLLEAFHNASNDILEKLSVFELNDMKKKMEVIIQSKQDTLNKLIRNMDMEVRNKGRIKDFEGGAKLLNEKIKFIENTLKELEKQVKTENKVFVDRSKIFGIKYNYLIERWELFLLDFLNTIQEEQLRLQDDLIQNYTSALVVALREGYVPLSKIGSDLSFKHGFVHNRLLALIGEAKLPGKIDLQHDIYIEGDKQLDEEALANLEIMRATNVKAYLLMRRLSNLFKVLAPILTAVASLFAIGSYLIKLPPAGLLIATPLIILGVLIIYFWIRRGRDKTISFKSRVRTKI